MKPKLFSFQMPPEIYDYLKKSAKDNYTDMTKYIVNLIAQDKQKKEIEK